MTTPSRNPASGFTLIELVMVVLIIGVLAAVALPRFVNLGQDARIAAVTNMAGTVKSAADIASAKCVVSTTCSPSVAHSSGNPSYPTRVVINGTTVFFHWGYPIPWGEPNASHYVGLQGIGYFVQGTGFTMKRTTHAHERFFTLNSAPDPDNCAVRYAFPSADIAPSLIITAITSGC